MKLYIRREERWILIVSLCLYGINKCCRSGIWKITFMQCYFNDIIAGAVFGIVIHITTRFWLKREISVVPYLLLILLAGSYWEFVAPLYLKHSISDMGDIVAYLSGGICLLLLLKMLSGGKR